MVEVSGDYHLNIPNPLTKEWLDKMMTHDTMNEGRREVLEKVTPAFFEELEKFLIDLEKDLHGYLTIRFKLSDDKSILIRNDALLNPDLPMSYPAHTLFAMRYVGEAMIDRNEVPDHVFEWLNRAVHQENSITDTIKNLFGIIFEAAKQQHGFLPEEVIPYLPPVLASNMMKTIRQNDRNLRMLYEYLQITEELSPQDFSRLEKLRDLAFQGHEQPPLKINALENDQEAGALLHALIKRLNQKGIIEASSADRLSYHADALITGDTRKSGRKWLAEQEISKAEYLEDTKISTTATLLNKYFAAQQALAQKGR